MRSQSLSRRPRRGITVVWVAITLTVLIMFVGLALDAGYVHITGHQLQNAADASALAGAARVKLPNQQQAAILDAVYVASQNNAAGAAVQLDAAAGDVVIGWYDRHSEFGAPQLYTSLPTGKQYNAVKVVARRTADSPGGALNLIFGPIFGINTSDVSRQAIAMSGGTLGAGMIALHPTRRWAFNMNGTATVDVVGGLIQVNSSDAAAARVVGTGDVLADALRIYGGISSNGTPTLPDDVWPNTSPVPDPLAHLPAPSKSNYTQHPPINVSGGVTHNAQPGYYPGGVSITGNSTVNFAPGVYLLGPPGLSATSGTINAPGVMFYFTTGNNPNQYGRADIGGNVVLNMTPPTSGPYAGIAMFADRTAPFPNNPNSTNTIIGNAASSLGGTLYFPSTPLSIGGTSDQFANQIIAATIEVQGTGVLKVNYDGRNPAEANNVFLIR